MPAEEAERTLLRCCGSGRWARAMAARRPFADPAAALDACEEVWRTLGPDDWLEAISHHPRIGGTDGARARFASTRAWSRGEQSGVAASDAVTRAALAAGEKAYENRFGYIFLICATGRSGEEILADLDSRLTHDEATELRTAAEELRRIAELRLEKLCVDERDHDSRP